MERIACDHVITRDEVGMRGETCSFVMVDRYSGLLSIFPCKSKSSEEVEEALRRFCGRLRPHIVSVASDRAPEILAALKRLGFNPEPSAPRDPIHNPLAESMIRTVKGMTSSVLLHSGLSREFWPLAQRYLEWAYNITVQARNCDESMPCFEKAHGYPFEGFLVPFGALVWVKRVAESSYEPKGEPALFLGAELLSGLKFKGLYITWPLSNFREGLLKERVTRNIVVPPGKWCFPGLIGKDPAIQAPPSFPGYLGEQIDNLAESDSFSDKLEELEDLFGEQPEALGPAPVAGEASSSSKPTVEDEPKIRNRAITKMRILVHGKTKGCDACSNGHYSHTMECRDRFNKLLDRLEPMSKESVPAPKTPEPPFEYSPEVDYDEDISGLVTVTTGDSVRHMSGGLERGKEVVASLFMAAIDEGEDEDFLSEEFGRIMNEVIRTVPTKAKPKKEWFVEFCSVPESSCQKVAAHFKIPYMALSVNFGNLLCDEVFCQVEFWFLERVNETEAVHLWGSILPGRFSFKKVQVLLQRFRSLSSIAIDSGGSSSFEWPKGYQGWRDPEITSMISELEMYASFPVGCGLEVACAERKPSQEWMVVSTSARLSTELNKHCCVHAHEQALSQLPHVCALKKATVIVSSLCLSSIMENVPDLPTVKGAIAHQEQGLWMAQIALALVHKPLTREEIMRNPAAKQAVMNEADDMRQIPVWDESELFEVDQLIKQAQESNTEIHIAEMMPICSIKNAELPEAKQKLRGRLVFRGDDCRDQHGNLALFRDMKTLPAAVYTINLVLYFGLRYGHKVEISDATKAYLQSPLQSPTPTLVILPKIIWRPAWFSQFRKVAARLDRALYGHPTSGDDWGEFFNQILVTKLSGKRVENFPSLWHIASMDVLVAAYVDDVIAAGPSKQVDKFWGLVKQHVRFDSVTAPGRYLGRDHLIWELNGGKEVFMSMGDYAKSTYQLYEDQFGVVLKPAETPYVSESMLVTENFEQKGQLAGSAAQLLMKALWLARLSRPDLSYAIVSLAGNISTWCRNNDIQLKKLLGYIKHTFDFGLWGRVSSEVEIPRLLLYCDADLAGDVKTCKSHTGLFVVLESNSGEIFPLSWGSRRQSAVARSTTEAEVAAANEVVFSEGIPLKTVLEMALNSPVETVLCEDNSSCILILKSGYSPKLRSMSRTHKISVAALSEAITMNLIGLKQTPTSDQLADIFTKALNRAKFAELRLRIGIGRS